MRVLLDASQVYHPRDHAYKYCRELIPRLRRSPELDLQVLESPVGLVQDERSLARFIPGRGLRRRIELLGWRARGTLRGHHAGPLFHSLYYTVPPDPGMPLLALVHDTIAEKFGDELGCPRDEAFLARKAECVRRAAHLIANSQKTKDDFAEWYGIPASRIDVVHFGVDAAFFGRPHTADEEAIFRQHHRLTGPYVLQVGGRLHHKNFPRLLEAFALGRFSSSHRLVAAGEPLEPHELALIHRWGLEGKVLNVVRPSEETLRLLYRCATVFVYPSLYEGFGIPPIEAMASGVPVAAARAGAIPEVAGEAALFFDPTSPREMADAIATLLDGANGDPYRERGLRRARALSWDAAAERTLAVYRKIAPP